ncbi:hypothetical protein ABZP36_035546 [Zizania latifolia]
MVPAPPAISPARLHKLVTSQSNSFLALELVTVTSPMNSLFVSGPSPLPLHPQLLLRLLSVLSSTGSYFPSVRHLRRPLRAPRRVTLPLLFHRLRSLHVSPNSKTYRILTQSLCRQGQVRKAATLLDEMLHRGIPADPLAAGIHHRAERPHPSAARSSFERLAACCASSEAVVSQLTLYTTTQLSSDCAVRDGHWMPASKVEEAARMMIRMFEFGMAQHVEIWSSVMRSNCNDDDNAGVVFVASDERKKAVLKASNTNSRNTWR